jgi:hypothetical protein
MNDSASGQTAAEGTPSTTPTNGADQTIAADQRVADVGTQSPTQTVDVTSSALPGDPTAKATRTTDAIHNAFLMGWSLQELKSTVLLAALGLQQSSSNGDLASKTGSTNGSSATETPHSLSSMVDKLLQGARASALSVTSQMLGLPGDSKKSLAQTSEWRANFIRLATVHDQCFPSSTTENTPYDPSPVSSPESRFPFLYPDTSHGSPDYALIGMNDSSSVGVGGFGNDEHLGKFKLYDVTRRALNCLTLLYTKPAESLLPDLVSNLQTQIVESFSIQTQASDKGSQKSTNGEAGNPKGSDGGATGNQKNTDEETTAVVSVLEAYLNGVSAGPSPDTLNEAIKSLSFLIVRFLDSWDGYLRENFYAGGILPNNELELLAYEASYALSSLSSTVSLMTMPLENASDADSTAAHLLSKLSSPWQNVFTSSYINTIQRQISELGPALDDAYYILKNVPRPSAGERPNPDLPSNIIHAITYSLDYWQRGVNWICNQNLGDITKSATTTTATIDKATTSTTVSTPPVSTTVSKTTTKAAIETDTTSTSVSTSPANETEKPPPMTPEVSRQLCQALQSQAGIWQSLMLGQQTLRSFTAESVTRRILNNIMSEFESAAKQVETEHVKSEMERLRTPMIVAGILVLVIVGGGIVLLALTGQLQSLAAVIALSIGSALALVSAGLSRVSSTFFPTSNEPSAPSSTTANNANLEQRLGSLFGQAGETIVTAFQNAYKQILIEFDYLNHSVAISYPLIGIFVDSPDIGEDIKDGYYFLTKVAWTSEDQKDELDRVAHAAFGPLGALISPPSKTPPA